MVGPVRDELDVQRNDLTHEPAYAEFVASPAFAEWQRAGRKEVQTLQARIAGQ